MYSRAEEVEEKRLQRFFSPVVCQRGREHHMGGGWDRGSPEATLINEKRTWCPVYIYTRETQHHTFCPLKSCHSEFFHTRLNCILAEKIVVPRNSLILTSSTYIFQKIIIRFFCLSNFFIQNSCNHVSTSFRARLGSGHPGP